MLENHGETASPCIVNAESLMLESFELLLGYKIVGDSHSHHMVSLRGVLTGYSDLDDITGGIRPGELLLVTGESGTGKTSLVSNIAVNVAKQEADGACVLVFGREMNDAAMGLRMLSSESKVPLTKMRWGALDEEDWAALTNAAYGISRLDMYICDDLLLTPEGMCAIIQDMAKQAKILLVVLDGPTDLGWLSALKEAAWSVDAPAIATALVSQPESKHLVDFEVRLEPGKVLFRDWASEQIVATLVSNRVGPTGSLAMRLTPECFRFDNYPGQADGMYRRNDRDVGELAREIGWSRDEVSDALNDAYEERFGQSAGWRKRPGGEKNS